MHKKSGVSTGLALQRRDRQRREAERSLYRFERMSREGEVQRRVFLAVADQQPDATELLALLLLPCGSSRTGQPLLQLGFSGKAARGEVRIICSSVLGSH